MSRNRKIDFAAGIQDGIPICLGYIAVSFTFGIMAKNAGLSTWEAVLISLIKPDQRRAICWSFTDYGIRILF